jgi:hypothetical protein
LPPTLKEKHRMFENMVLRRIFGLERQEVTKDWRKYRMNRFIICTLLQSLIG